MKRYLFPVLVLLVGVIQLEAAGNLAVSGYFKNFSIYFLMPKIQLLETELKSQDMGAINNRFRLRLSYKPLSGLGLFAAYDLSPRIQNKELFKGDLFSPGLEPNPYRVTDLRSRIFPGPKGQLENFGLFHNLDRLYVSIRLKSADVIIGRQAVAWGSARIINPTDIIAPFTFNELDTEERKGVDSIRVRIPLGMMDELDMGFVAGKDFEWQKSAFFMRGKFYLLKTDISLLSMGFCEHLLVGADVARSIGGASFWLESAYVLPYFFNKDKNGNEKNYFRSSAGIDYNLNSKTYGYIEYHFNSAGKNQPKNYNDFYQSSAFRDGSVYLAGKHYLGAGIVYQAAPLIPVTGFILYNLSDNSLTFAPQAEYNIAENIYLSGGAYISTGERPENIIDPQLGTITRMHSEFGAYPDMIFASLRIYF